MLFLNNLNNTQTCLTNEVQLRIKPVLVVGTWICTQNQIDL